ncbi:hypothetical protein EON63_09545 [archaeon]|nr:MAG: hypothetical protein EON63_09545 [archaeon]
MFAFHIIIQTFEFAVRTISEVTKPGAAGAAFKGALHLSHLSSSSGAMRMVTVAYDQRLSVWSLTWSDALDMGTVLAGVNWRSHTVVCLKSNSGARHLDWTADSTNAIASATNLNLPIELVWLEGAMVNIAEISSLYVYGVRDDWSAIVVGEGFQILKHV